MSIESDSEFFEVFKIGEIGGVYRRNHYSLYNGANIFYNDIGHAGRKDRTDDSGFGDAVEAADDELIEFVRDADSEENDFSFDLTEKYESGEESMFLDEYEMDVMDVLNPSEQIKSYEADRWELTSIIGDKILFKRQKCAGF